jgi:hypothetical protein
MRKILFVAKKTKGTKGFVYTGYCADCNTFGTVFFRSDRLCCATCTP